MLAIEMALIEMCHQIFAAYATQDLCCRKCQQIQRSNLDMYCACSGNWGNKELQAESVRSLLKIVRQKAEFHGMRWLHETLDRYGVE